MKSDEKDPVDAGDAAVVVACTLAPARFRDAGGDREAASPGRVVVAADVAAWPPLAEDEVDRAPVLVSPTAAWHDFFLLFPLDASGFSRSISAAVLGCHSPAAVEVVGVFDCPGGGSTVVIAGESG